jgi:hypothetical protein
MGKIGVLLRLLILKIKTVVDLALVIEPLALLVFAPEKDIMVPIGRSVMAQS